MTNLRYRYSVAAVLVLAAIAVAGIGFMSTQDSQPQQASAASGGGPEMVLSVPSHDNCSGPIQSPICTLATGTTFTISVDLLNPPPNGYIMAQAWIDYDDQGLVDKNNIQAAWPDCEPTTFLTSQDQWNNGAAAGCLTALLTQPPSFYGGSIYTFELTCTDSPSTSTISQIPSGLPPAGTSGTLIYELNGPDIIPKVGDLTIECLGLPEPGDSDGDGCSDQQEFGNDETLGGQRDFQNPWDFYDVAGPAGGPPDGSIDLPNDILSVLQHFSPQGQPPDGVIDLPIDILGVIWQFGHSCG